MLLGCLVCYSVTGSTQVSHEMQLRIVLASPHRKDCLVLAGTESGKTLPIALSVLLDDLEQKLITLTLLPLKCLQITQESNFNSCYGIPTVVINKDTLRGGTSFLGNHNHRGMSQPLSSGGN